MFGDLFFGFCCLQCTTPSSNKMESEFKNPPSSVKTGTYWYWIEGNIPKKGVDKRFGGNEGRWN